MLKKICKFKKIYMYLIKKFPGSSNTQQISKECKLEHKYFKAP